MFNIRLRQEIDDLKKTVKLLEAACYQEKKDRVYDKVKAMVEELVPIDNLYLRVELIEPRVSEVFGFTFDSINVKIKRYESYQTFEKSFKYLYNIKNELKRYSKKTWKNLLG